MTFHVTCHFCKTATLLPSVTWGKKYIIEYKWEGLTSTAIPPAAASDTVGQDNEIGGTAFRAAHVKYII